MPESWAASGAAPSPVQRVLYSQKYLGLSQSARGWTRHSFRSGPEKRGKKPFLEWAAVPWGTKSPGEWPHTTKSRSH